MSAFWAKVSKREILKNHPNRKEKLTDNWKANFFVFLLLFLGLLFFLFFVFLGPPHLALNPPFSFVFFCFFCFFFGGFKGQVRWPEGATSLGPKPSFLCFCFVWFFVLFFGLLLIQKKPCFPPEKGIFCLFSVFLFLSPLAFFGLPLFLFLFLCLSLFFSFFLSSFLSFLFAFFWFLVFVSFFLFLSSLLLFHERNNIKILNCKFCLHQYFLFFGFLSFFVSSSFLLSLLFPDFKLCFLFNIKVFDFQTSNLKNKKQMVKRGVATKRFFLSTCVLENVKSYRFFVWAIFLAIFGWCSKTL